MPRKGLLLNFAICKVAILHVRIKVEALQYYYPSPIHVHVFPGAGLAESDENCKKFLERTVYDSFQKVYISGNVHCGHIKGLLYYSTHFQCRVDSIDVLYHPGKYRNECFRLL